MLRVTFISAQLAYTVTTQADVFLLINNLMITETTMLETLQLLCFCQLLDSMRLHVQLSHSPFSFISLSHSLSLFVCVRYTLSWHAVKAHCN